MIELSKFSSEYSRADVYGYNLDDLIKGKASYSIKLHSITSHAVRNNPSGDLVFQINADFDQRKKNFTRRKKK